jgi:hypothetical protein
MVFFINASNVMTMCQLSHVAKDLLVYLLIAKYVKSTAVDTKSQNARRRFGIYGERRMALK